jgi:hypothetical protein
MTRPERAILGAAVAAIPAVLMAVWMVPSGAHVLALVVPPSGIVLGAALALWRVPPFPWLESKLGKDGD